MNFLLGRKKTISFASMGNIFRSRRGFPEVKWSLLTLRIFSSSPIPQILSSMRTFLFMYINNNKINRVQWIWEMVKIAQRIQHRCLTFICKIEHLGDLWSKFFIVLYELWTSRPGCKTNPGSNNVVPSAYFAFIRNSLRCVPFTSSNALYTLSERKRISVIYTHAKLPTSKYSEWMKSIYCFVLYVKNIAMHI